MQDKLINEEDAVAMAQLLELIAGMKREMDHVLHIAKLPGSTLEDIAEESAKLLEKTFDFEIALAIERDMGYDDE